MKNSINELAHILNMIYTSYHEVGHVIYGLLHLIKVDSVKIFSYNNSEQKYLGLADIWVIDEQNSIDNDFIKFRIISEICMRYSGLNAEKILFKINSGTDNIPSIIKRGASEDTTLSAYLIRKNNLASSKEERRLLKNKLIKHSTYILEKYWDDVCLISHSLFKKKKLSYLEIEKILTEKSKNKRFWKNHFKLLKRIFDNKIPINEDIIKEYLIRNNIYYSLLNIAC